MKPLLDEIAPLISAGFDQNADPVVLAQAALAVVEKRLVSEAINQGGGNLWSKVRDIWEAVKEGEDYETTR